MSGPLADRLSLAGRAALVTGASGTLGAHFAETLAAAGASVVLAARRTEAMRTVAERIRSAGGEARVVPLDVTDPASVVAAFDDAEGALGRPLDVIVNNSGIASPGAALEQSEQDWAGLLEVNLGGARRVAVEAARRLVAAERPGSIVNIASILGLRQGAGVTAYATSKAALVQLTKQLALEWARHGIRVNALAPGYVETELNRDFFASEAGRAMVRRIPQRRLGEPDDLDGPLLLLAADAGAYITGAVLTVDGGHLLSPL